MKNKKRNNNKVSIGVYEDNKSEQFIKSDDLMNYFEWENQMKLKEMPIMILIVVVMLIILIFLDKYGLLFPEIS